MLDGVRQVKNERTILAKAAVALTGQEQPSLSSISGIARMW